jgi:response regulator NasT
MKNALLCSADLVERNRLKFKLEGLGFAEIMESGDTGRALAMAFDQLPELAIIDISAMGKGWPATIASIRDRLNIPVILIGKSFSAELLEQALAAGAGGFLVKPVREEELWPAIELASVHDHEVEDLKEQLAELKGALESRKIVEKAKGVLMRSSGLSEPEAFRKIRKLAMDKRKTLREIAEAILLTEN